MASDNDQMKTFEKDVITFSGYVSASVDGMAA